MPSPFPGMNPYLEQDDAWEDFHTTFITFARDALRGQLGPNYFAKVEVRLYIRELPDEDTRSFARGDVGVMTPQTAVLSTLTLRAIQAPVRIALDPVDVQKQRYLEIYDRRDRRIVTVLELLSPTNKRSGVDRDGYLRKRFRLLDSPAHFIEIDLLRGGDRPTPPLLPACDYYTLVSRVQDRPMLEIWPIALRETLPTVPVPLSPPDPDASLDLQAILHRVYDSGDYEKFIYSDTPKVPLGLEDAAWAQQFIPSTS